MNSLSQVKILGRTSLVIVFLVAAMLGVSMLMPSVAAFSSSPFSSYSSSSSSSANASCSLPSKTLVSAPPAGAKGPDDITLMATRGLDGGKELIWTAYQNGINADGTPGTPGGPTKSTVAGYDPSTGALIRTIKVTGKVDGLTADPAIGRLIATVNEDVHSSFNLIDPASGKVTTFTYKPNPAVNGAGGTDSIAVRRGDIFVAHSNPIDVTQPTDYLVTLDTSTLTAHLTPVFFDDSRATDALTGTTVRLGLTDPDTNFFMPNASPSFAGDLATISQGDGQIVFASHLGGKPQLTVLSVTDNIRGNVPPIDGLAVATSNQGTLYVVDNVAGKIRALDTPGCQTGTVFVGEPNDNGNPLVGILHLSTGKITPVLTNFVSPKGLLFVPAP